MAGNTLGSTSGDLKGLLEDQEVKAQAREAMRLYLSDRVDALKRELDHLRVDGLLRGSHFWPKERKDRPQCYITPANMEIRAAVSGRLNDRLRVCVVRLGIGYARGEGERVRAFVWAPNGSGWALRRSWDGFEAQVDTITVEDFCAHLIAALDWPEPLL